MPKNRLVGTIKCPTCHCAARCRTLCRRGFHRNPGATAMPASPPKTERLDVRLPSATKRTIEQAAAQLGQSVSTFIVTTMTQYAHKVLRDQSTFELSAR